jgi:hypothetical protein
MRLMLDAAIATILVQDWGDAEALGRRTQFKVEARR